jgi:hypothetical protein
MEVITIESKAFKELEEKIDTIAEFVIAAQNKGEEPPEDTWVDSYEVCTFLKISPRTLQRLRSSGVIGYSKIRGKNFYKINEIKRMLEERIIRSTRECMQNLIQHHRQHVERKENTTTKK